MADIAELMHANLFEVFGERDPQRRRAAIERTYHPDVVFVDPDEIVTGHDALDDKVDKILGEAPEFTFALDGPLYVNHDLAYLAWTFGPEGAPVVRGFDVAFVRDGLIAKMYTILRGE